MRGFSHTHLDDTLLRIWVAVARMKGLPHNLILGDISTNMIVLKAIEEIRVQINSLDLQEI